MMNPIRTIAFTMALLLFSPLLAQATSAYGTGMFGTAIPGREGTVKDWTLDPFHFLTWYSFHNNVSPTNSAGDSCQPLHCGLTWNGGTSQSTFAIEGTRSQLFDGSGDYLSCAAGTCTTLNPSGSFSWGAWFYPIDISGTRTADIMARGGSTTGYAIKVYYDATNSPFPMTVSCVLGGSVTASLSLTYSLAWHNVACAYDAAGGTLRIDYYAAGSSSSSTQTGASYVSASASDFKIGSGPDGDFNGYIDSAWVADIALPSWDTCRICSCAPGGADCGNGTVDCISGTWRQSGNNSTCNLCDRGQCDKAL